MKAHLHGRPTPTSGFKNKTWKETALHLLFQLHLHFNIILQKIHRPNISEVQLQLGCETRPDCGRDSHKRF